MISPFVDHAGTSPVISQMILSLMLVVLGILVVGTGFRFIMKNKQGLLFHRWILSASLILALGAVFFVMLPTLFRYRVDPDVESFSSLSITTIIHGVIGFPALITALNYAFGDMPANVKNGCASHQSCGYRPYYSE